MLSVYLLSHGGCVGIVPEALQIGRLPAGAAGPDQQVAAELEDAAPPATGSLPVAKCGDALVGRQFGGSGVPKIERDAAEELLMIGDVLGAERVVALRRWRARAASTRACGSAETSW